MRRRGSAAPLVVVGICKFPERISGEATLRVLLIEDDARTAAGIEMLLRTQNYVVDATDLGEDGLEIAKLYDYDIIVLDLILPDIDGYEVLRRLRAAKVYTPVLILSGLGATGTDSRIKCLGLGADDFLTKPFDRRELIARIQAIVRRVRGHADSVIHLGKLTLNLQQRRIDVDGHRLNMPNNEYRVLELLCLRKGATVTKEMFLNHLYGGIDEPDSKVIDVYICKLRQKLRLAMGGSSCIETVWGRGYVMRDPLVKAVA
jgi:two-component system, cell cycle response regulator CtrA